MANNRPIVSICIPTFRRPEIVSQTLEGIYSQSVDHDLFEVCISDNSPSDETKDVIERKFSNIDNLRYNKSDCLGFLNSIEALKLGKGEFLKLHNDYSNFKTGMLKKFIDSVRDNQSDEAMLFFSMGALRNSNKHANYENFDGFLDNIHYYSTWSSAFGINKDDFDFLMRTGIQVDHMYPHTSLLYALTGKNKYFVDDTEYVSNLELKKKGGYNLIDNFVRIYLTMTKDLLTKRNITQQTYDKIENGIIKFCANWRNIVRFDSRYSFTFADERQIIEKICGEKGYHKYELWTKIYFVKQLVKRFVRMTEI